MLVKRKWRVLSSSLLPLLSIQAIAFQTWKSRLTGRPHFSFRFLLCFIVAKTAAKTHPNGACRTATAGPRSERLPTGCSKISSAFPVLMLPGKSTRTNCELGFTDAHALCATHHAEIGDQKIGQILSAAPVGTDGLWPCQEVRNVLEEMWHARYGDRRSSQRHNSRGVHARAEGGVQERALAEKYRSYSRKLSFDSPYVANLVEGIAERYDRQAEMWDSEDAVRRRLGH